MEHLCCAGWRAWTRIERRELDCVGRAAWSWAGFEAPVILAARSDYSMAVIPGREPWLAGPESMTTDLD